MTTEEWDSNTNTHIITKEFYDGTQTTSKYYKLVITEYLNIGNVVYSTIANNTVIISEDNNINSTTDVIIREEKLYYGNSLIATKTVKQRRVDNKVITTETVIRN